MMTPPEPSPASDLPVIVLLEDADPRAEWLAKQGKLMNYSVWWSKNVKDFLEFVDDAKRADRLFMIVMDHDLGHADDQGLLHHDAQGLDGSDAAEMLSEDLDVPVLVWSHNQYGAARMHAYLKDKTNAEIRLVSYLERNHLLLSSFIFSCLREYKAQTSYRGK